MEKRSRLDFFTGKKMGGTLSEVTKEERKVSDAWASPMKKRCHKGAYRYSEHTFLNQGGKESTC